MLEYEEMDNSRMIDGTATITYHFLLKLHFSINKIKNLNY